MENSKQILDSTVQMLAGANSLLTALTQNYDKLTDEQKAQYNEAMSKIKVANEKLANIKNAS